MNTRGQNAKADNITPETKRARYSTANTGASIQLVMPTGKKSPHGDPSSSETSTSITTPESDQEEPKNQSRESTKDSEKATNHSNVNEEPDKAHPIIHPDIKAQYNEAINLQPMDADQYRITDVYGDKIEMNWDQFYKSFTTLKKTGAEETFRKHPKLSNLDLNRQPIEQIIGCSNYDGWALLEGLDFIDVYPNPDVPSILYAVTHVNKFYPRDHHNTIKRIKVTFDEFLQKANFTLDTKKQNDAENTNDFTFKVTKICFQKLTQPLMLQVTYSAFSNDCDLDVLDAHLTGFDYSLIGGTVVLPNEEPRTMHSFQCVIDWRVKDPLQPPLNHKSGSTVQVLNQ